MAKQQNTTDKGERHARPSRDDWGDLSAPRLECRRYNHACRPRALRKEVTAILQDCVFSTDIKSPIEIATAQIEAVIVEGIRRSIRSETDTDKARSLLCTTSEICWAALNNSPLTFRSAAYRELRASAVGTAWLARLLSVRQSPFHDEKLELRLSEMVAQYHLPRFPGDVLTAPGLLLREVCAYALCETAVSARDLRPVPQLLLAGTKEEQVVSAAVLLKFASEPRLREESSWSKVRRGVLNLRAEVAPHLQGTARQLIDTAANMVLG